MTASKLVDGVKIVANTTGTGAITLGEAVPSFRGIEALTNGAQYSYGIQTDGQFEWGTGTYLSASRQLTRSPIWSSDGGTPIDLPTNAQVSFVVLAEDMDITQSSAAAQAAALAAEQAAEQTSLDATNTAAYASTASDAANLVVAALSTPRPRLAIFIIAGQSNSAGRNNPVATTLNVSTGYDITRSELPDARILTFSCPDTSHNGLWNGDGTGNIYINKITIANEPLCHGDGRHGMGHGWTTVRNLLDAGLPAQKALLVPCAVGGTPIDYPIGSPGYWGAGNDPANPVNPGGALYEAAIAQAQLAMSEALRLGYDAYFAGIIWHQGENNASNPPATYQLLLDAVFNGFRQRLGVPDLPIIAGSFIYEAVVGGAGYNDGSYHYAAVRQVIIDTARRLPHTSFFYGPGPGYQFDTGTNFLHFNADGQRILANGAQEAFAIAQANVAGAVPLAPQAVYLEQSGTTINVWWRRPICRATDYNVQWSTDPNGPWTPVTKPAGPIVTANVDCGQRELPAATITDIPEGALHYVGVQTVNEDGVSGFTVASVMSVSLPDQVTGVALASITDSHASLAWSAAAGADSYGMRYSSDGGTTWIVAQAGIAGFSGTISGLDPAVAYLFDVYASNARGDGTPSASASGTTAALVTLDSVLTSGAQAKAFGYYSVSRNLKAAYTGPLIQVRRTSDNTTQDIGQTAAKVLDKAALAAFLGTSDGYLTKVYDQSGAAHDVAQAVVANQPRIAIAGAVVTINGRPVADQTMDALRVMESATTGLYAAGKATAFASLRATSAQAVVMECGTGGNPRYAPISVGTSGNTLARIIVNDAGTAIDTSNTATQVQVHDGFHTVGVVDSGSSLLVRQDGVTVETKAYTRSGTVTPGRLCIFGQHTGATYIGVTGYLAEIVLFTDALSSTDYAAVEANMAAWSNTHA